MNNIKQKGLMTEGSIFKNLLYFAIPLLIGNIFQQLYNTVDSIVVGNFIGDDALAAVNSSGAIINMLVSFFMGLSMGGSVVISNYFGAQDDEGVHKAVHTTIALTLICGIAVTVIGVILTPYILEWVNVDPDVMEDSITYLRIFFGGVIGLVIYNIGTGILRAVGDSKNPLYFLIFSTVLNIILDLLFVAVFKLGVAGVALATIMAQLISAILTIALLMRSQYSYKLYLSKIKIYKDIMIKVLKIGFPSAIQNGVISFSNLIVQTNINSFGKVAMAGVGCYTKVDGFALMPVMSFSMALTTFVGQNIGAQKYDRVKSSVKVGMIMSCTTTAVISLLLIIFAPQIMSIFTDNSDIIAIGELMMRTVVPGYLLLAVSHVLAGVLRGAGLTKIPMYVMVVCWCVCRVTWISIITKVFDGIQFVFMGWPITWTLSAIIFIIYYKKSNWISKKI